ncbi:MAG: hypothetical protein QOH40_28 [Arthrobacter pascens]|jgi:hypothetical protein|nr:hypothetical protein [Arthrobacter pascens]
MLAKRGAIMHELSVTQGPVGAVPDTTGERPATALNVGIALFPFHGCGGADVGVPGQRPRLKSSEVP